MGPEGKLRDAVTKNFKKLRTSGERIWWLKVHGGPAQRAGVPDFIGCYLGLMFAIELKVDTKVSLIQQSELRWLDAAGGMVAVCRTLGDVEDFLREVRNVATNLLKGDDCYWLDADGGIRGFNPETD